MATFIVFMKGGEKKELTAYSFQNRDGFFEFYEEPDDPEVTPVKFVVAVEEVSTIERLP